jgi:arylformamidase
MIVTMGSDPFKTRDHVSNFDDYAVEYQARSEVSRKTLKMLRNVSYGPGTNEKLDLFFPSAPVQGCPVHLFIHGGYWRMFSKDDFSFIADTVTACGAIAAIMEYNLMPAVRMEKMVQQVRQAFSWLHENASHYGGDQQRLSISGHSAGAHLPTFTFTVQQDAIPRSALLLSGVYDLEPLQKSFLKSLIALTDEEVRRFSPMRQRHSSEPNVSVVYGENETEPFMKQASSFSRHLTESGAANSIVELTSCNHMSAVRDLGTARTRAGQLVQSIIQLVR